MTIAGITLWKAGAVDSTPGCLYIRSGAGLGAAAFATLEAKLKQGVKPMKFRPLHDRVVVEPLDGDDRTAGGIIIPDTAKEKPMQGKVVSVGPGARGEDGKLQKPDVKKGDSILYGKWSGTEVKLEGKTLLIMRESDVMGILE